MARQGLNGSLTYDKNGQTVGYRVRASMVSSGFTMVADESQARTKRAFYPHQTAPSQFALRVDLKGFDERRSFSKFLMDYASYILDINLQARRTPLMRVLVPSRNFERYGVPVEGIEFGDVVGSMLFQPTVVFESMGEPQDWNSKFFASRVFDQLSEYVEPESTFFYPTGSAYTGGIQLAPQALQDAVNGTQTSPSLIEQQKQQEIARFEGVI